MPTIPLPCCQVAQGGASGPSDIDKLASDLLQRLATGQAGLSAEAAAAVAAQLPAASAPAPAAPAPPPPPPPGSRIPMPPPQPRAALTAKENIPAGSSGASAAAGGSSTRGAAAGQGASFMDSLKATIQGKSAADLLRWVAGAMCARRSGSCHCHSCWLLLYHAQADHAM
jgi:hypothetical protein